MDRAAALSTFKLGKSATERSDMMKRHVDFIKEIYGNDRFVCGTLCGVQNYEAELSPDSSIDTVFYILPPFNDSGVEEDLISDKHEIEGGTVEVRDIRTLTKDIMGGRLADLELLVSPFFTCNHRYAELITPIVLHADRVTLLNCEDIFISIAKQVQEQVDRFAKTNRGVDLADTMRLLKFLEIYSLTLSFKKTIHAIREWSFQLEYIKAYSFEDDDPSTSEGIVEKVANKTKEIVKNFSELDLGDTKKGRKVVCEYLDNHTKKIIENYLYADFLSKGISR